MAILATKTTIFKDKMVVFNATDFLERSRNGRIVFAGDSIGRNQWESLICMLAQGGAFLVVTGRPPPKASKEVRTTLRVDTLHWYSNKWVKADVLMFSAGHWWNQDKTVKMGCFFQVGETVNMTMDVMEAFQRSLQTWKSWVIQSLDPQRSHIFFRSYSPVHYRDGTWNEGGHCDANVAPETNNTKLEPDPVNNLFISDVIKQMESAKRKIQFLNITYLAEFRKDGHPSSHREVGTPIPAPQDCSHWCLPGVPDTWNELLYAQLLSNGFRTKIEGT
ncbi:unnamed protein product [Ilex paraguariensis]|uniref:Trichome birefringence-like C-terminal domain-containing protein n=1 Tax=Ilex paraguariensis TaxID=185542 RepID=A0ABC8T1Q3_9AQUA